MAAEIRNNGTKERQSLLEQRRGKHFSVNMNRQAIIEELLE
jgi:hypothetical protein